MLQKEFSELSDQELLAQAKKMKTTSITHAVLIGLMIGVVIYGVAKNNIGFFGLIPLLYIIFKMLKSSDKSEVIKKLLQERNLKT